MQNAVEGWRYRFSVSGNEQQLKDVEGGRRHCSSMAWVVQLQSSKVLGWDMNDPTHGYFTGCSLLDGVVMGWILQCELQPDQP